MATSVESPSPAHPLQKESSSLNACSSSSVFSPSSDERFWNTLRSRIDMILENRKPPEQPQLSVELEGKAGRLKEDSMLLLRGFDSVAQTLSHLSNNLESALQGARDLSRPPTITEIVEAKNEEQQGEHKEEVNIRGLKRKLDTEEEEDAPEVKGRCSYDMGTIQKAKNMAISMATKAAFMARELKSVRSHLGFVQDRCSALEEENRKLRDGLGNCIGPDEDDLIRLQLEALLAEKSRLASENANLKRENQCLHQLVEYHQMTSLDLSASYENLVKDLGLDFSDEGYYKTPRTDLSEFSKTLDEFFDEELESRIAD